MRIEKVGTSDVIMLDVSPTEVRMVPLDALAAFSELLGVDDTAEVLAYIEHIHENGEPEPDPVTGDNVYTEAFRAIEDEVQAAKRKDIAMTDANLGNARLMSRSAVNVADAVIENAMTKKQMKQAELRVKLERGKKPKVSKEARAAAVHVDSPVTTINLAKHKQQFRKNLI